MFTKFIITCRFGDLKHLDFDTLSSNEKEYGLVTASEKGNFKNVKYLIEEKGVDIHTDYDRPFTEACNRGHYDIVLYLLQKGAKFWTQDDLAFCYACMNGHYKIAKHLISIGVDISAQEDFPIRYACHNGHLNIVKLLVSEGVNPTIYENICLIWASMNGHYEVVKYLISLGADVHSKQDVSVYNADKNGYYDVVHYLVTKGAVTIHLSDKAKAYIAFCEKMQEKKRHRAQKKIYFWWIPICYDLERECGQRMRQKNYEKYLELHI